MEAVSRSLSSANWTVLGASVQGVNHLRDAIPCQDAFGFRLASDEILVIAAADGLGSAPFSALGASLAVKTGLDWLEAQLSQATPGAPAEWEALILDAMGEIQSSLDQQAALQQTTIHDFATTLLLAVAAPTLLITGQIGDGAIVAMARDGDLVTISPPQNGEYINETFSITSPNPGEIAFIQVSPMEVDGLALFSDGLQRLTLHAQDNTPHLPFFSPLFQQMAGVRDGAEAAAALAAFLSSERVNALTSDDKTLVLARQKGMASLSGDEAG